MLDASDVGVNVFLILVINVVHDSVVHVLVCTGDKNYFIFYFCVQLAYQLYRCFCFTFDQRSYHIETSQLIYRTNWLTCFHMMRILIVYGLNLIGEMFVRNTSLPAIYVTFATPVTAVFILDDGSTLCWKPWTSRDSSSKRLTLLFFLCSRNCDVSVRVAPNGCEWRSAQT